MSTGGVAEDDEWIYGESAGTDLIKEEMAASASETTADHENDKDANTDVEASHEATGMEDDAEKHDDVDDEGKDGDGGRGRKRGSEAIEGEEVSSEERDGEESEDEEDSDDDGVMVTIGDIKGQGGSPGFAGKRSGVPPPDKKGKFSVEDFDGTGHINGVPAQDFNLDALEDKPWRKPGADITDYFNYGFTEDTWRAYSDRQKRLRYEAGAGGHSGQGDGKYSGGSGQQNIIFPKKFGMQGQQRNKDGPMNMMGMGIPPLGMGMRRENHSENTIQVMTADRREYSRKQYEMGPPPMMGPPFDMSIPPPPFPPRGGDFMGPPEFFNHPPPDYYDEGPEYEEQQWMDSQWEMEGDGGRGPGPSALVVPLTKVTEVPPPPPGEAPEEGDSLDGIKTESS